jgi:SAM-dependent methyltransferase
MSTPSGSERQYFETRFTEDPRREKLWRHLTAYLSQFFPPNAAILELAAGYCHFINHVPAAKRVAVDAGPQVVSAAAPGVEAHQGDAIAFLESLREGEFDVIFASNFLEHLDRVDIERILPLVLRALKPGGRFAIVQPNFRLAPRRYFDDYTHRTMFTDVSIVDWFTAVGFRVVKVVPRFLPLTVKSKMGGLTFLVPVYLRLPWRPFAGQMFVLAERPR